MTPYYDDGQIVIYHGDCRDVLPSLSPVDLVLTDPPYNVGLEYTSPVDDSRADYDQWCAEWFAACRRLAPVVAISPGIANIALWYGIEAPTWQLLWLKPAATGRGPCGFNNWEPVPVWGRPKKPASNDVFTATILPLDPDASGHPCPKPLKWALHCLHRLAPAGGAVCDPFMGAGTVMRAARDLRMRGIGIEIEERYCEIAARRLERARQQPLPLEVS